LHWKLGGRRPTENIDLGGANIDGLTILTGEYRESGVFMISFNLG
jgi:hypothetical protein